MGSLSFCCMLSALMTITGLSHGVGVLPDNLNGAAGGSVFFNTTVTPPEKPFLTVVWTFNSGSGDRNIITSTSSDAIEPGYENRITFNRSTGSLELRNLTMDDTGEYRTVLTPDGGVQKTGTCRLEIFMPVSNVVVTPNSTDLIEFHSSVSLSCSSSGSPRSYTWLNGSSEVTASEGVQITDGGSTLTIISVTRNDQGPFQCRAFNPVSHGISDPVSLSISFGPENTNMKLSPSQEYHEKGSNIILSCSAGSRPLAQFQWALNGALLSVTGPELRLNNIQMNQSGNYSCQAHNIKTLRYQTSQPSRVTVLERVSAASITEPPVTPVEGKPVNLTCDAAGSVLTREWRKDGSPVSPGSNIILHDNNRVLSFSPLKRTDSGEYSCTASNPASSAEAKYKMTVNFGPENVTITGPNEIKVTQALTLICSAESTPTATFIWMKNGTEIHRNSAEFTKSEVELSDSGEYTCQAGNNITERTEISDVHRLSVGPQEDGGLSAGAIAGITIACLIVVGGVVGGVVYYMSKKGKLMNNKSSNGNTSARTGDGQDNRAHQDLNYADINHLRNNGSRAVQIRMQPTTEYAEVRANSAPGAASSLPSYNAHMQKRTGPALQPATQPGPNVASLYAQVRKP